MFNIQRSFNFGKMGIAIKAVPLNDLSLHTEQPSKTWIESEYDAIKDTIKTGSRIRATSVSGTEIVGKVVSISQATSTRKAIVRVKNSETLKIEDVITSTIHPLLETHRAKTFKDFVLQ